jgi:beta-glucosidase
MRQSCALSALIVVLVVLAAPAQTPGPPQPAVQKPPYLDPNLPVEQRVNDLVSRMTLEEKISQMQDVAPAVPRLGIPAYNWWNEALHGVARAGYATVFPQAIGLAATWDTDLIHRVADIISTEARAKYNDALLRGPTQRYFGLTFWSPNINLYRDPRWGRGQETYGEDPYLTSRIGVAFVTGLQGDDPRYLKTVSTPKHYAVHSGPEVLRHAFDVPVSPRDFADTYAPAFRATVIEGKAWSVMCAYNAVRGEPACLSSLLFETLRQHWGFRGYVVSDCGAINDIYRGHGYTLSLAQASALAVKAGTDLTCGNEYTILTHAVRDRLLAPADIDRAVKRLFEARFRLGMFDPPEMVPWSKLTLADNDTPEHHRVALETARKSIVLLKNDRGILPLKSTVKTIAVVGPVADSLSMMLGNYTGTPSTYSTPLEGIRRRFADAKVVYTPGSPLTDNHPIPIPGTHLRTGGPGSPAGLKAEYFNNRDLAGAPAFTRVDTDVNFNWSRSAPAPSVTPQNFSARWTGEFVPPVDGEYLLGGSADDGFRVWLDGRKIAEDWAVHSEHAMASYVRLQGGHAYSIRMEYFQAVRDSVARLVWIPPALLTDAVDAAKKADVVIAVVGLTAQLEGEEMDVSAAGFFGGDRTDIGLPRPQQQMLEALAATGKPLVVVLTSGSAVATGWAQEHAAAVIALWYPGGEGGAALADVLAGDYNPAGRLPVTFYSSVAQLPPFSNYSMAGRTYRYFQGTPLYPFGYGLSYTTFAYRNARVDRASAAAGETLTVSVEVKNTGARAGDEVVQLYLSHPDVEDAPTRELQGFTRIHLAPNEEKTVSLLLRDRQYSIVDPSGKRRILPGKIEVWIGGGQPGAPPGLTQPAGGKTEFRITSAAELPD